MASSQIRQFATLIDQLPCESDDFNLIGNLEDYNKCFEVPTHNNIKNYGSFPQFNSKIGDYINTISSNSEINLKCKKGNNKKNYNGSINKISNLENPNNSKNKFNDGKKLSHSNLKNSPKSSSNSHNNNYQNKQINKKKSNDENGTINKNNKNGNNKSFNNKNNASNGSNTDENSINSLLYHTTVLKNETDICSKKDINSCMKEIRCKNSISKKDFQNKNTVCKINNVILNERYDNDSSNKCPSTNVKIGHNNDLNNESIECIMVNIPENKKIINYNEDGNYGHFDKYEKSSEYANDDNGESYNNFGNGGKCDNEDASMYNFSNTINDKTYEDAEQNIIYRYNTNSNVAHCKNHKNNQSKTNLNSFKTSLYTNKENQHSDLQMDSTFFNNEGNGNEINKSDIIIDHINHDDFDDKPNSKEMSNANSIVIYYKDFCDILKKNDEMNKKILLSKKAKIIKIEPNKSLIIFPINMHEYGDKYIAVNQNDLLDYIVSSIEIDKDDNNISSLKIRNYQKEKELQNIKAAYSMQTTNIHYLINRVIFKECEYENLKNINLTLEQEISKLIQEVNYLLMLNKDGLYMQKLFIDYKCKCVLKLQQLQPLLGDYYLDIFNCITSCRTLGQLSIWIPSFEMKDNGSLENIANSLINILLNGLAAPINSSPHYFYNSKNKNDSNDNSKEKTGKKQFLNKSISFHSEEDIFLNNMTKGKTSDNYLVNNLNNPDVIRGNSSQLCNCYSLSLNSESSFLGTEELYFNSSKFPSMHSVILKNPNDKQNPTKNEVDIEHISQERIIDHQGLNKLNRSHTAPEQTYINNEFYTNIDIGSNNSHYIYNNNNVKNRNNTLDKLLITQDDKKNFKRKQLTPNNEKKDNKKLKCKDKTVLNNFFQNNSEIEMMKNPKVQNTVTEEKELDKKDEDINEKNEE
ncbi:conserved Plasmodium protein, unknown function [Plasmodium vinckei vinckei]|uniref:Asparagine-rich protein n=1 Tax=Plasmodium vinckei vinckei TaxID=54757 RepID=A0A449BY33_PLAVN|nr:conserved Plasmodium protein, unknown function [Plasmodium vinckei vinckei]KEG04621.1 hypothetical protein YYE_00196 [Plasmodium vinckei vinckei]VEV58272.1 conserved Plasmodium protein, unknown function [Plasmodium vinckei vinckei]